MSGRSDFDVFVMELAGFITLCDIMQIHDVERTPEDESWWGDLQYMYEWAHTFDQTSGEVREFANAFRMELNDVSDTIKDLTQKMQKKLAAWIEPHSRWIHFKNDRPYEVLRVDPGSDGFVVVYRPLYDNPDCVRPEGGISHQGQEFRRELVEFLMKVEYPDWKYTGPRFRKEKTA